MWDWANLDIAYFGVPYGNYRGWFLTVFIYSAVVDLLPRRERTAAVWLNVSAACAAAVAGVAAAKFVFDALVPVPLAGPAVGALLLGAAVIVLACHPRTRAPRDTLSLVISTLTQGYFLAAGVFSGMFVQAPALLVISLITLGFLSALYRPAST
jgi:uncharacterized membrane protein